MHSTSRIDVVDLYNGKHQVLSRSEFGTRSVVFARLDEGSGTFAMITLSRDRFGDNETVSGAVRIANDKLADFDAALVQARRAYEGRAA
jgi:hypothetical protein